MEATASVTTPWLGYVTAHPNWQLLGGYTHREFPAWKNGENDG